MSEMDGKTPHNSHLLLLTVGFLSITAAIIGAYSSPATSYELSIYQQTPTIFWIGIIVGVILSVIIAFRSVKSYIQGAALSLGVLSIIAVISLPIIRNYYYYGEADSLSHLGIALDINEGTVSVFDQLYPMSHILSIGISHITGLEIRRGLVLLVAIFAIVFILFVPLTASLFSDSHWIINISIFSSLLLLPTNHFTGHMHPHPTSYAIFFIPLLIYLFICIMKNYSHSHFILMNISMFSTILLHPQQAANILILFGTVAISQITVKAFLYKQQSYQLIYPHVVLMAIIFWLWTEALKKISGNITSVIARFLVRAERETAGNVRSAVPSLEAAGGSPEEIFIKLFLVGFIYCIFCAILMWASLSELFSNDPNILYKYGKQVAFPSTSSNLIVIHLTLGFIAITGMFIIYILADQSAQYFRHHSFIMVLVTIIGSLSIGQLLEIAGRNMSKKTLIRGICIIFIIFLLHSVPIIHVSPYLYQESQHVPEKQVKGYETAFEYQGEAIPFAHIRSNHGRYHDAIAGRSERQSLNTAELFTPPYHFSEQGRLRSHYEEQTYLAVTSRDRTRDRDLHRGIRYTRKDYEHFDKEIGIDRIQDNGEFTLYRINPL